MIICQRHMLAVLLVTVKLFALFYGQDLFFEPVSTGSAKTESVCIQDREVPGHETEKSPLHNILCHELEQPGLIASALMIHCYPARSTLASSDKDEKLPGYRSPIKIPPRSQV